MANKYEADTRYLFVNTAGLKNQGDQINNIKLNLGSRPFESDDDSLIQMSLTQFNMAKNFYNINSTNNTFRVFISGFTHSGTGVVIDDVDTLLKLSPGDYLTSMQLQTVFAEKLKVILDSAVNSGGTSMTFTVARIANKTDFFTIKETGANNVAQPDQADKINKNLFGILVTASNSSFRYDNNIQIQSLHIAPSDGLKTLSTGVILTADEQFNDSATLVGGIRSTNFSTSADENAFSIKPDPDSLHTCNILGYFPINSGLHTLPYVYLRVNTVINQTTSNFENVSHNHQGDTVPSHILAKIERKSMMPDESVYYRSNDEVVYLNNITQNRLNDLQFSVTDHYGRVIPQNDLGNNIAHFGDSLYNSTTKKINKEGNLFCDFTLKIQRLSIPFMQNILQGTPPVQRQNPDVIKTSIPILNSSFGF